MTIQLATYSHYNDKTKKRENLEFFIQGKQVDHERYLECIDEFNAEYTQKTGEDNNGILRLKNINKIQSNLQSNNIQFNQQNQSCGKDCCPDCGEPYDESDLEEENEYCGCPDCQSKIIIEDCLNFVLGTDATPDEKAQKIFNMALGMREIGFEECVEENSQHGSQGSSNDTYNINVTVSNSKNTSKVIGNIVEELKKNKNNSKQNVNVSEDKE